MKPAIDDVDELQRRADHLVVKLGYDLNRLVSDLRVHSRHNEKEDSARAIIALLEETAAQVKKLADMHRPPFAAGLRAANDVLRRQPTLIISETCVANPSGSGQEGGYSP